MKFIAALFVLLGHFSFSHSDKKKTIYIVRHGETYLSTDSSPEVLGFFGVPLNRIGIAHCKGAGDFLANENIGKIYYSELPRAKLSAECIARQHSTKVEMIQENTLIDLSWGFYAGCYEELFREELDLEKYILHPEKFIIPNGESFYKVMNRLRLFFVKFWESDEDTCTIVTNEVISNSLSLMFMQAPLEKFWAMHMSACGVSKVQMKNIYSFTIEYWNANYFLKEAEKKYLKKPINLK